MADTGRFEEVLQVEFEAGIATTCPEFSHCSLVGVSIIGIDEPFDPGQEYVQYTISCQEGCPLTDPELRTAILAQALQRAANHPEVDVTITSQKFFTD